MAHDAQFTVENRGSYIHLVTRGKLDLENLDEPANAALALAKKENVSKLLDDIRYIDSSNVSIQIQAKAMGILWKLRSFNKVAIVYDSPRIGELFFSTLQAIHLAAPFKGFENEAEAVSWLEQP